MTESHGHCPLCESLLLPVAVSVRITQGDLAAQARGELAAARGDIEAATTYYTAAQTGFREAKNEYAATQCAETLAQLQS